jgi:5-methylcytosine-specific restriction enzyme B
VAGVGAAANAKGLPSESRQTAQRSPGWMTEPPSSWTRSSVVARSATVKYGREAVSPGPGTYVLIIDELNRGNVAKVFGELYFLLEYRGETVELQYASSGDSDFWLPDNLWFIGTMNTADQSIALLDSALRRRFYFIDFYPTEYPIDRLLRRWLERNGYSSLDWLAKVVDEVNRRLGNREIALGPSYFMDQDRELTPERIDLLWRHAVLPYLEEQFFGDESQRADYQLDTLRTAIERPPSSPEEPEPAAEAPPTPADESPN